MARAFQDCILLFGDSLTADTYTQGSLAARFADAYHRKLDVLNRGFGGYNTDLARDIFDEIFAKKGEGSQDIRLITIWFGTNDSVLPPNTRHLSIETFKINLNFFLHSLTSSDSQYDVAHSSKPVSIILMTPPALCPTSPNQSSGAKSSPVRTKERMEAFRQAVLEVGQEWAPRLNENGSGGEGGMSKFKIASVDCCDALMRAAGGKEEELKPFYKDDVHLTPAGYEVIWTAVASTIKSEFKGRGIDWQDMDDLAFTAKCPRCNLKRCRSFRT